MVQGLEGVGWLVQEWLHEREQIVPAKGMKIRRKIHNAASTRTQTEIWDIPVDKQDSYRPDWKARCL